MAFNLGFTLDSDRFARHPIQVHCGNDKCNFEWAIAYGPLPIDDMLKSMAAIGKKCPMCRRRKVMMGPCPRITAEGNWMAWLHNGDTGVSSLTIWNTMTRTMPQGREHSTFLPGGVPGDPADFGRCYRLLQVMPEWRSRLQEVAKRFPAWKPIIDVWSELTALYEEEIPYGVGDAPKLYARMRELVPPPPSMEEQAEKMAEKIVERIKERDGKAEDEGAGVRRADQPADDADSGDL